MHANDNTAARPAAVPARMQEIFALNAGSTMREQVLALTRPGSLARPARRSVPHESPRRLRVLRDCA